MGLRDSLEDLGANPGPPRHRDSDYPNSGKSNTPNLFLSRDALQCRYPPPAQRCAETCARRTLRQERPSRAELGPRKPIAEFHFQGGVRSSLLREECRSVLLEVRSRRRPSSCESFTCGPDWSTFCVSHERFKLALGQIHQTTEPVSELSMPLASLRLASNTCFIRIRAPLNLTWMHIFLVSILLN